MENTTQKPLVQRIQERLAASRFLTVSLFLHAVLVVMGGSVVLFKHYVEPPDFVAEGGVLGTEVNVVPPQEQLPDLTQVNFTPDQPTLSAPSVSAITSTSMTATNFTMSAAPVPVMKAIGEIKATSAPKTLSSRTGKGLPSTMSGRAGGNARAAAMMKNGGKQPSEDAVMRGLRWLVKTQDPDGTWSKEQHGPAMTGLAILCFLGHGETPASPEFGPTVKKAIHWLLTEGAENEGRLNMRNGFFDQVSVYTHGIVAYALGEYYMMTKDESAVKLLKKATKHIIDGQGPDGGWMYAFDKSQSDTSVSGWQIQALKAAHLSGLNIEGVDASLDKAMLNLQRVRGKNGGYGYREPEDTYSLTGIGVLCTYFWKGSKDKSVQESVEFILDQTEKNFPVDYNLGNANLYTWYYHTQACLMVGGGTWTKWNRYFQDTIVKAQSPDGSWPPSGGHGEYLQKAADKAGPYYRTTLCILMLEVYYRYMPTTQ